MSAVVIIFCAFAFNSSACIAVTDNTPLWARDHFLRMDIVRRESRGRFAVSLDKLD